MNYHKLKLKKKKSLESKKRELEKLIENEQNSPVEKKGRSYLKGSQRDKITNELKVEIPNTNINDIFCCTSNRSNLSYSPENNTHRSVKVKLHSYRSKDTKNMNDMKGESLGSKNYMNRDGLNYKKYDFYLGRLFFS